ncbi:hypothetical protein SELMODRAFT_412212 [Selaginella moellendorffii]|uniref:GEX2 N-terminal Ig-like domain-containing protein n=1 Tax=Selaginella moellendorffii TaxID=88036 RepID=D8RKG0_SELML|nr:hypothetical protein SELMODRAFT_412212 [Selaginella moellendorffii]
MTPLFLWWLWVVFRGTANAQPGRDCLALCPQNNISCTLNCAQCDFPCCSLTCNSIRTGDTLKYLLTVSILSYGTWVPISTRFLKIISGPVHVPSCFAWWFNDTNSFVAGSAATLYIMQKDAFNNSGVQKVVFYPKLSGTFYLQIGNNSQVVQKSPLRYDVTAGPLSVIDSFAKWPSGINTFEAGSLASVMIMLVDTYGNSVVNANFSLSPYFLDSGTFSRINFNFTYPTSGYWSAGFTPIEAGQYLVRVGSGTVELPSSPLTFSVVSGPVSVRDCVGSWLNYNSVFQTGGLATFLVLQMDAYGNNVSLATGSIDVYEFISFVQNMADGKVMPQTVIQLQPPEIGSAYRTFTHSPNMTGQFNLFIGNLTDNITGSPFTFQVIPGKNASLKISKVDRYNESIYDDYGFAVKFISSDIDLPDFNVHVEKFPGTNYQIVSFVPTLAGKFSIAIGSGTENIANSPLTFNVNASFPSIPSCVGGWSNNINSFYAGDNAIFDIYVKDIFNNTVNNDIVQLNITTIDIPQSGRQLVKFTPTISGSFFLHIWRFNESISMSPFTFSVSSGVISPSNCTAIWPDGRNTFHAGQKSVLAIQLVDKFKNNVSTTNGRSEIAAFDVQIGTKKLNISGSPFPFTVKSGPLSIPASTGERPSGSQYFSQNATVSFLITPRDKFGNPLLASSVDPLSFSAALYNPDLTLIPIFDLTVSPYSSNVLIMNFSIYTIGKLILQVGNETDDIMGSPFVLFGATDSVSPSRSIMEATANVIDLDFQMKMQGVAFPVGANITAIPKTTGIFQVTYTATVIGNYLLLVSWKGALLGAGAVNKSVLPTGIYGPWCTAKGAGISGGVVGRMFSFQVTVMDFYNNTDTANRSAISVTFFPTARETMTITSIGTIVPTEQVNGSPFKVVIQSGSLSLPQCSCYWPQGINYTSSGQKSAIQVYQRDRFGNQVLSIQNNVTASHFNVTVFNSTDMSGPLIPIPDFGYRIYTATPSDWYEMRFTIIPMGTYSLDCYAGVNHYKGPFIFSIIQEPPNATLSIFDGSGLQNTRVGSVSSISITLIDNYGMPVVGNFQGYNTTFLLVTVSLVGSSVVQQGQVVENTTNRGQFLVTYAASVPGDYAVRITWKNVLLALYNITVSPAVPMFLRFL